MDAIRVALAALATYRLTQFIVIDDGPFDLMMNLRIKLGRYDFGLGNEPQTALGRMLECSHCVGKWVALCAALLVLYPNVVGDAILLSMGLAGIQSLIEERRSCHDEAVRVRRELARARRNGSQLSGSNTP